MKIKTLLNIISRIFFTMIFAVGALLIVLRICGVSAYTVETGSMGEEYPIGTMIFVKSTEPAKIEAGDVITFAADENFTAVTHRVVERNDDKKYFITRGDMNNTNDAPVAFENVAGKVVYKIDNIGYVINMINRPAGKWVLIAALAGLMILMIVQLYKDNRGKAAKKDEKI